MFENLMIAEGWNWFYDLSFLNIPVCPQAGVPWKNREGFFRVAHAPEGHPWTGKIVCCDWDAFCTKCLALDSDKSV